MNDQSLKIGKKTFLTSVFILWALMLFVGILTRVISPGSFDRVVVDGREMIEADSFRYIDTVDYPVWRWLTAPFEVLFSKDSTIIIVIILFLVIVGGAISVLNHSGVLNVMIDKAVTGFGNRKYALMFVITFIFMTFGAFFGIFEEIVPLVPIIMALSYKLGWDKLTGLGMSLLAAGFGFAAAVSNPFTIGVAQGIAELPVFSGVVYRFFIFIIFYLVLAIFLYRHTKRVKADEPDIAGIGKKSNRDSSKNCTMGALAAFYITILLMLIILVSTAFTDVLSDYSLPLIGLVFLAGGLGAGFMSNLKPLEVMKIFAKGLLGIAPAILLILMAASIKHIISTGGIMDTILYHATLLVKGSSSYTAVLSVFLLVLGMNFLIGSGSAKAFLIMPIVIPLADLLLINRQIMVLAFQFGDGFSNCIYPTNPVVLIALGLCSVSYGRWFKFTVKLQIVTVALNALLLATVSHHYAVKTDWAVFEKYHELMRELFPLVHRELQLTKINRYSLLYRWPGRDSTKKPILFISHMDVVPVEEGTEKDWEEKPFSGAQKDGFVWGRGTLDTKITMIGALEAVETLLKTGYVPEADIYLGFGHDEETGGKEGALHIARHLEEQGISFEYVVDEGGMIVEGSVPGVSKPVALVGVGEKGYADIEISVKKEGGHASMPPQHTSLGYIAKVIMNLENNQGRMRLSKPAAGFLRTVGPEMKGINKMILANLWLFKPLFMRVFSKTRAGNALLRTTTAATMASASVRPNVLPQKSTATFNFRIAPGETVQDLLDHIKRVNKGTDIEINPIQLEEPSSISSTDTKGFRTIERVANALFQDIIVAPYIVLAGTDAKKYEKVCSAVYRFAPFKVKSDDLNRMHGTNERISYENIEKCVQFYIQLIKEG